MTTADPVTAALEYAERGWPVIPLHSPTARGCSCGHADCASPAKHPRTVNGLKDASRDPAMVREWWRRWPDANIGIVTGPEGGILVLDVDGKQGEESLIDLERRGCQLPDTFTVRTGGGGQHLYFLWPEGADVRNSASKIAPGLDIRGQAGYVVAPPSLHVSGARYEVNESAIPLAPCPDWLLSLIQEPQIGPTRQSWAAAGAGTAKPIGKGQRTPMLSSLIGKLITQGVPMDGIEAAALGLNRTLAPPHMEEKVRKMVADMMRLYSNKASEPRESPNLKPDLVCLADVEARAVDWLWSPYIPARMLSMISGDPATGKSYIALAVAAELSCGRLRDGRIVDPASTLYLTCENPVAECLRPRFDSLGGNPALLHVLLGTRLTVEGEEQRGAVSLADIAMLDEAIVETHARLVIVDPLQSYFGANVDLHRSNETRPVLDGLMKLAEARGCAILLVRHLSKQSGGKAIYRGLSSIDLSAAVRSEMLAGSLPDDPDTRALVHIKTNVGRMGHTLGYAIDGEGRFSWTGESAITAADLLAAPAVPGDRKLAEASQWLADMLRAGSREQREVRELAEGVGITYATLRRAKNALRVRSHKAGMSGAWLWALPEDAHENAEGAQQNRVSTFGELSTFDSECGGVLQ